MNSITLEQLFKTPRMGHAPLDNVNSVEGLYSLIYYYFKPDFKIVEVGSFQGVSTMLFSKFVNTVYSVDCYDYKVPDTGRIPSHDQLFIDAEDIFIQRTKDIKNIVKIKKSSLEASKEFPNKSLDAVYIDAEHDEESVRSDIKAWLPKIKFGGYLCGHDFYLSHIQKILNEEGFQKITRSSDSSWLVQIPTVSLVAVASTKVRETIEALRKSRRQMDFNKIKLFTHEDIFDPDIEVIKIEELDYKGYNEFIACRLWSYIDTDFILLVQNDGYVLDGSLWTDDFLKYDYIGAPWPIPNDDKTYRTPDGRLVRVGNGGFSLRSRGLLEAPHILGLKFSDEGTGYWHEDGFICVHHRQELEEQGIKFAPVELAARFSTELTVPETVKSFGGHKYI